MKCIELKIDGIRYFVKVDKSVTLHCHDVNSESIYEEPLIKNKHDFDVKDAKKFINRALSVKINQ